jgi:methionyl-tRNA formyltransferase
MSDKKIIMLSGRGSSSTFMYNGLKDEFDILAVLVEDKGSKKKFLKRRIKKLGIVKVVGQMLFQMTVPRILTATSRGRIDEIKSTYKLDATPIPTEVIRQITTVNSPECIELIKSIDPDLIIVNGTRIISEKVLSSTSAPFINTHVGITPKYRGVHGGYWAVANNDKENCGVTVHIVDKGIDTGSILFQKTVALHPKDNFATYSLIQTGEGIALMKKAIRDFQQGKLQPISGPSCDSKLWYHPTLWTYLRKLILNGVK